MFAWRLNGPLPGAVPPGYEQMSLTAARFDLFSWKWMAMGFCSPSVVTRQGANAGHDDNVPGRKVVSLQVELGAVMDIWPSCASSCWNMIDRSKIEISNDVCDPYCVPRVMRTPHNSISMMPESQRAGPLPLQSQCSAEWFKDSSRLFLPATVPLTEEE